MTPKNEMWAGPGTNVDALETLPYEPDHPCLADMGTIEIEETDWKS